jgi:hypothetical protein
MSRTDVTDDCARMVVIVESTPEPQPELSPSQLQAGVKKLAGDFDGISPDLIEEMFVDCYEDLARTATVFTYLPLLAERLARERLRTFSDGDLRHWSGGTSAQKVFGEGASTTLHLPLKLRSS